METRGVASVDSDGLSESSGNELAIVASRDAVARLRGRLHLMHDGVRGLVCSALDGNQGLLAEQGCKGWVGAAAVGVRNPHMPTLFEDGHQGFSTATTHVITVIFKVRPVLQEIFCCWS